MRQDKILSFVHRFLRNMKTYYCINLSQCDELYTASMLRRSAFLPLYIQQMSHLPLFRMQVSMVVGIGWNVHIHSSGNVHTVFF